MSVGKFLGGTVIATPAVGGGGYVIYKEVTKETTTTDPATVPTRDLAGASGGTSSEGESERELGTEGDREVQSGVVAGSPAVIDQGKAKSAATASPAPVVGVPAVSGGVVGSAPEAGSGLPSGSSSLGK